MNKSLDPVAPLLVRRATAVLLAFALVAGSFAAFQPGAAFAQKTLSPAAKSARLSDEQRILHVLNRLGFGARPGDVERVRKLGLENYIEQQLAPERIEDAAAEAKLRGLSSYWMTTAELYAKYPQPGRLLRALERQGRLPADLAELRENRTKGGNEAMKPAPDAKQDTQGAMSNDAAAAMKAGETGAANADGRRGYRQAIQEYYRENNLLQPARITAELQSSRILRATYSERQLQEVLVDFWTNHFNVYANKGADRWLLVSYDRDTIRPRTLGKFKDLLLATAQSPAMLFFLDNYQSVSPTAGRAAARMRPRVKRFSGTLALPQAGGNEAGAEQQGEQRRRRMNRRRQLMREGANAEVETVMPAADNGTEMPGAQAQTPPAPPQQPRRMRRGINENYARELMELHTLGVEGGYTQKDVQEVARAFTGWTIFDPRGQGGAAGLTNPERAGTFFFNPRLHDDGEKIVLGHKIPAGGGINDGMLVLDILSKHPSTAKFIATKLARRFVSDNPTPALVERIASAYTKSDGDIRTTLRAIFASPEFNAPENYRAKIKTPFELAISAVRSLGGETTGAPALHQWIARMGEPLYQYQAPTGYPDTAEHWVNTGALLERMNFALALVGNRINGTRVDLSRFNGAGGAGADKSRLIEQFAAVILQGNMSERTKSALLKQLNEATATTHATLNNATNQATTAGEMNNDDSMMPRAGGGGGGRRRGGGRREMLAAGAPITEAARIAALILGSPEFQRQ